MDIKNKNVQKVFAELENRGLHYDWIQAIQYRENYVEIHIKEKFQVEAAKESTETLNVYYGLRISYDDDDNIETEQLGLYAGNSEIQIISDLRNDDYERYGGVYEDRKDFDDNFNDFGYEMKFIGTLEK